ncbi:MAG: riboflavin synthase [Treponema sp.]|nr:riboflavin synthase [Treponema sp.]
MFTGIIEEQGTVVQLVQAGNSSFIKIHCATVLDDLKIGDSVAVNGICLTATTVGSDFFTADVMPETIRCTDLHLVHAGTKVNLERAMSANGRFGGHIVTGHIDGTGTITSVAHDKNAVIYTVRAANALIKGIVRKGSVAIDGISLTVVSVSDIKGGDGVFSVSVIPHTREVTSLGIKHRGSTVNIECDVLGKYAARFVAGVLNKEDKKEGSVWNAMMR